MHYATTLWGGVDDVLARLSATIAKFFVVICETVRAMDIFFIAIHKVQFLQGPDLPSVCFDFALRHF